ncbi:amidohydrolase family protein [Streptomyces ficellus]|uniref:Amidohydrolase family protein n=1 Tax=Streptomyces ficellus TaxID=1977088 RepID=A0ABT7YZC7_9ACTN|nr:amidohydrolase family protein [Streptomyces ficellus]MDN3292567.1 amidohydrolase family protein [Streptomyces ficellus]
MTVVVDVNRMLGPLPHDDVPSRDETGLLAELERLRIDTACVSHAYAVHGDPRDGNGQLGLIGDRRLLPVPVLVPGPLGTGRWTGGAPLARLCPRLHGWSPTGPHARGLLAELAASGTTVLLARDEVTAAEVRVLAAAAPAPRIVLTGTGYRALRELAELLETHPSLYVDTSTLCGHRQVEWLAERYGAHRVLFGTGAPVTDDAGPRHLLDTLDLPGADVALIAGGNALRLLGGEP